MQSFPEAINISIIYLTTLLLLVFSLIRISATWRYRVNRSTESNLSLFSQFGAKLANGGHHVFNGINLFVAMVGHGVLLTLGLYYFLQGDGIGFILPLSLTVVGSIIFLGYIQFTGIGKRWYDNSNLERNYYASDCDNSILENKIKTVVEIINEGDARDSSKAIQDLESILRLGYDVGQNTRSVLSKIDSKLYSEYESTRITRLTRLKATIILLLIGTTIYFLSILAPHIINHEWWSSFIEYVFGLIMSNYVIQPVLLLFGYEGSLDTKFV